VNQFGFEMDARFYDPEARPLEPGAKLAVAVDSLSKLPLNALRYAASGDQCGWFVWGGDMSDSTNFFSPMCWEHLQERSPQLAPYLSLGPGWRILLAPNQVDVWFDDALLSM
jgi:hypothetical protein